MNNLNAIGNVGKDSVLAYTKAGDPILNFSFALQAGYGDKQVTSWMNCSIFGKRAETLAPMILKGIRIGITGEVVNRPYTTKEGIEKYSLECRVSNVTLLGAKPDGDYGSTQRQAPQPNDPNTFDDFESDVPF